MLSRSLQTPVAMSQCHKHRVWPWVVEDKNIIETQQHKHGGLHTAAVSCELCMHHVTDHKHCSQTAIVHESDDAWCLKCCCCDTRANITISYILREVATDNEIVDNGISQHDLARAVPRIGRLTLCMLSILRDKILHGLTCI